MGNQSGDELGNDPLGIALIIGCVVVFVVAMLITRWWSRRSDGRRSIER